MQVTDTKRTLYKGTKQTKEITGFYMDGYLKKNLDGIPNFLKKAWDVVGIVSGHGKVRIGKSTIAAQSCYYIAWRLAGGETIVNDQNQVIKHISPKKPVRFNLKENVVFSADDLQERAVSLYNKYGPNQVIMYDEGRQGLDSARSMESINKGMDDFFQECGFMGHVIIIVLPNFFKLHEDYAVARSIFLIDAFADSHFNRGYFNFYNERQKEYLFYFGKKRIGVTAKYQSANESFYGKFTKWLPFDKDEYEKIKKGALEKKRLAKSDRKMRMQRDILVWFIIKSLNCSYDDIRTILRDVGDLEINERTLQNCVVHVNDIKTRAKGY